jgi:hypothetical protein
MPAKIKRKIKPTPSPIRNSRITNKTPALQLAGNDGRKGEATGVRARDNPKIEKTLIGAGIKELSHGGQKYRIQPARRLTRRKFCHMTIRLFMQDSSTCVVG